MARRRAKQNEIDNQKDYVRHVHRADLLSNWETCTDGEIARNKTTALCRSRIQEDDENLQRRQSALRHLYQSETEDWTERVRKKQHVSMEDKMDEIRTKAYKLRDEREAVRQNFVKDCYQRQWEGNCEDARALERDQFNKRILQGQKLGLQLHEQLKKKEDPKEQKRKVEWNRQMEAASQCERDEARAKEEREKSLTMSVQAQKLQHEHEKVRERQEHDQYEKELLAKWKREREDQKERAQATETEARARGKLDRDINSVRRSERERNKALEKDRDRTLLQYHLEKEADALAKEEAKRRCDQDTLTLFREEKEKEDFSDLERRRTEAADRVWNKRDEELEARSEKQRQAAFEIQETLALQIFEKKRQEEEDREEAAIYHAEQQAKVQSELEIEKRKEVDRQSQVVANKKANKVLMGTQMQQQDQAKQSERKSNQEQWRKEEMEYDDNLAAMQRKMKHIL
jgi:hypothetical protein